MRDAFSVTSGGPEGGPSFRVRKPGEGAASEYPKLIRSPGRRSTSTSHPAHRRARWTQSSQTHWIRIAVGTAQQVYGGHAGKSREVVAAGDGLDVLEHEHGDNQVELLCTDRSQSTSKASAGCGASVRHLSIIGGKSKPVTCAAMRLRNETSCRRHTRNRGLGEDPGQLYGRNVGSEGLAVLESREDVLTKIVGGRRLRNREPVVPASHRADVQKMVEIESSARSRTRVGRMPR